MKLIFVNLSRILLYISVVLVIISCSNTSDNNLKAPEKEYIRHVNKYAKGFEIHQAKDHYIIKFIDLENETGFSSLAYFFTDPLNPKREFIDGHTFSIPLGKIALESTTHASYLLKLGVEENIKGITYAQFVQDSTLKSAIKDGELVNISAAESIDLEKLLSIDAEALTISPFSAGSMDKYRSVGVPVIVISEYLEQHPLATAEWIKVFGIMYNKQKEAELLFNGIEERYNALKKTAILSSYSPSVVIGSEYNGQWSMPGGESNLSTLIRDAGGYYVFGDRPGNSNTQIDIEVLLDKASEVDYWGKISSSPLSASNFGLDQSRLGTLKAVRNGNLFFCNSTSTDYFVKSCVEPDIVLSDLIDIFHPDIQLKNDPVYFRAIDE